MTKQEIALLNFAQRISTGYMTVAIGDKLSFGEPAYDLKLRLRQIQQLHKLFDYEYGKPDSDEELLYSTVLLINTLLNNFRLAGTYTVRETEIVPIQAKYANFIVAGGGGSGNYTFTNGIKVKDGVVSLGLDISTIGTTSEGLLTTDLYLVRGNLQNSYTALAVTSGGVQLSATDTFLDSLIGTVVSPQGALSRIITYHKTSGKEGGISTEIYNTFNTISLRAMAHNIGVMFRHNILDPAQSFMMVYNVGIGGFEYSDNNDALGKLREGWLPSWRAVKEASGIAFIVTEPINTHIEVNTPNMYKVTITAPVTVGAETAPPGYKGTVIIVQDDFGGHLTTLKSPNKGTVVLNTLPRAVTELTWIRTDTDIYWQSRILDAGIRPTPLPVIAIDDYYDTLELFHSFLDSDILMSVNNGAWEPYLGKFSIGAVDRPAGYWRFKVIEAPGRLESGISYSLPTHAIKTGFTYTLPFGLT